MKDTITLKELSYLPSKSLPVTPATAPTSPEASSQPTSVVQDVHVPMDKGNKFREWLRQRFAAPFPCKTTSQRGGIKKGTTGREPSRSPQFYYDGF